MVPEELIALLTSDAFGLRTYRCNAPPVQPFDGAEDEAQATLARVFAPGPWRIDGMRERRSANHDAIVKDLEEKGAESDYAKAVCPFSGVTALHACAINGYLTLFKLLVDVGKCDPTTCASGLATMMSSRLERAREEVDVIKAERDSARQELDEKIELLQHLERPEPVELQRLLRLLRPARAQRPARD